MVKLFVGNLSDRVDSTALRKLISQHANVRECDVLKNYAFVHVASDEEAETVRKRLDNYVLEGRPIHIEKSTSRLRKEPGMSEVCFRCGLADHKTPNCPLDRAEDSRRQRRRSPATNGSKRSLHGIQDNYPPAKRGGSSPPRFSHQPIPSVGYAGGATGGQPQQAYYVPQQQIGSWYGGAQQQQQQQPTVTSYAGYAGGAPHIAAPPQATAASREAADPPLPKPRDSELDQLFDSYATSRERYYYYRERLEREMMARGGIRASAPMQPPATPIQQSPYAIAAPPQQQQTTYNYAGMDMQQQQTPAAYSAAFEAAARQMAPATALNGQPTAGMIAQQQAYGSAASATSDVVRYPDSAAYYQQQTAATTTLQPQQQQQYQQQAQTSAYYGLYSSQVAGQPAQQGTAGAAAGRMLF